MLDRFAAIAPQPDRIAEIGRAEFAIAKALAAVTSGTIVGEKLGARLAGIGLAAQ